jgi:hypothetical protein
MRLEDMAQASGWRQLCMLLWRHWLAYPRNRSYTLARLVVTLIVACCFGSLYQGKVCGGGFARLPPPPGFGSSSGGGARSWLLRPGICLNG